MAYKVAILGTGNVAFHLMKGFHQDQSIHLHLISRSETKAHQLLDQLGFQVPVHTQGDHSLQDFDLVCIAVPDQAIKNVIASTQFHTKTIIVHTSGPQPISLISDRYSKSGVLYPFQTFTKSKSVDFKKIPLLIEGNSDRISETINSIANCLGPNVYKVDSQERLKIHLAAVFACNFSNNLYRITSQLLKDTPLDFSDFNHLIFETADKAFELGPIKAQTGPAIRNDEEVLQKHLELIDDEQIKALYKLHSEIIRRS